MPHGQSSCGLILDKHVAETVIVPVRQVDAHTRTWDGQRDGDAMTPIWWGMNVLKKVGRVSVAVHVNPDVIIAPAACHIAIENSIA
jgi:hypothetical protein